MNAGQANPTAIFAALGDPTRNALIQRLSEQGGGTATSLAASASVSRQAIDRHLRVLSDAGLIWSQRQGREVVYALQAATLVQAGQWLEDLGRQWESRLLAVKAAAEQGQGST